jgi:RNase P subunit RPR2
MKKSLSKSEAIDKINSFFSKPFTLKEVKKIKRLAMKYRISLKPHKGRFCKSCFSELKGKIKVSKEYKTITCEKCGKKNKRRIQ